MLLPMHIELAVGIMLLSRGKHRADHAAADRIQTVDPRILLKRHILAVFDHNILFIQPAVNIIEIQHSIDKAAVQDILCLLLLGDARSKNTTFASGPYSFFSTIPWAIIGDTTGAI